MKNEIYINGVPAQARGLILTDYKIGPARPNLQYIDVPGRNGKLDVTDFMGLTYQNRQIIVQLAALDGNHYQQARQQLEMLNGQKVRLTFATDPELYWAGRLQLDGYRKRTVAASNIEFSVDAEPFPRDVITGEVVQDVQDLY